MSNFWTTSGELAFLEGLGTFCPYAPKKVKQVSPEHRLKLLLGYREGIKKRVNWEKIDRQTVESAVKFMIDKLSPA